MRRTEKTGVHRCGVPGALVELYLLFNGFGATKTFVSSDAPSVPQVAACEHDHDSVVGRLPAS
eukprot:1625061-Pyramimonas_sp.AAC.1